LCRAVNRTSIGIPTAIWLSRTELAGRMLVRGSGGVSGAPEEPVTDQRDQEPSEDYSYDLAHEVKSGAERQPDETRSAPRTAARPGTGGMEPDGDYGYDEAHDL
jgi:hypothetical protein